jgi:hypothetical protein
MHKLKEGGLYSPPLIVCPDSIAVELLNMQCHRPRRAGLDAKLAGQAFLVLEINLSRLDFNFESTGRADADTRPAVGAALFIADDIMPERLDADAGILEVLDSPVVIFGRTGEFDDHRPLGVLVDGCLEDVEIEIKFFSEAAHDGPVDHSLRKMKYDSFGDCHPIYLSCEPLAISYQPSAFHLSIQD